MDCIREGCFLTGRILLIACGGKAIRTLTVHCLFFNVVRHLWDGPGRLRRNDEGLAGIYSLVPAGIRYPEALQRPDDHKFHNILQGIDHLLMKVGRKADTETAIGTDMPGHRNQLIGNIP